MPALVRVPMLLSAYVPAATHPIGGWKMAGIIVAIFLTLLGLTMWVGSLRTRRRERP